MRWFRWVLVAPAALLAALALQVLLYLTLPYLRVPESLSGLVMWPATGWAFVQGGSRTAPFGRPATSVVLGVIFVLGMVGALFLVPYARYRPVEVQYLELALGALAALITAAIIFRKNPDWA